MARSFPEKPAGTTLATDLISEQPKGRVMKKIGLSVALSIAIAIAMAATPSEAAAKKKAKAAKPAPATPVMVGHFQGCVSNGTKTFGPVGGSISAVGCGAILAVPVMLEAFLAPRKT